MRSVNEDYIEEEYACGFLGVSPAPGFSPALLLTPKPPPVPNPLHQVPIPPILPSLHLLTLPPVYPGALFCFHFPGFLGLLCYLVSLGLRIVG